MELPFNKENPLVMHIDMDSCFATIEQQANPLLRGKPVIVAAFDTPRGFILSASIEAKKLGIRGLMQIREAREIYPHVIIRTPDPPMIRDIHIKLKTILAVYSPTVVAKSIDEFVIDFAPMENILQKSLFDIGREIKIRIREEIGEWISCSIGISTNRFLAKMGASVGKPDGLELITHTNAIDMYKKITLRDLYGINIGYERRLNMAGITTPLEFLQTPVDILQKQIFKSICGYYWYMRLRGWEVDAVEFTRKSYGQQYALAKKTKNKEELSRLLMKLTEKMGRRLRAVEKSARGIHVGIYYDDYSYWHRGRTDEKELYTTSELFLEAKKILYEQPEEKIVRKISVQCFNLVPAQNAQLNLFNTQDELKKHKLRSVSQATDMINNKYGEFTITPAFMMSMDKTIVDAIAFGRVNELTKSVEG